MKLYHLSLGTLIIRFYLMMAVVLLAGFIGMWTVGLLALPIFFSCMLGLKITSGKGQSDHLTQSTEVRQHLIRANPRAQHAA
jgi:heme A synthase